MENKDHTHSELITLDQEGKGRRANPSASYLGKQIRTTRTQSSIKKLTPLHSLNIITQSATGRCTGDTCLVISTEITRNRKFLMSITQHSSNFHVRKLSNFKY